MSEAVRPSWWRRARHSLRVRLVLLFLLLAVAMSAVFLGGIGKAFSSGWRGAVDPLIGDYADRLVAEIGSPPSVERAQAIAAHLPVVVHISGPQVNWASGARPQRGPLWAREDRPDRAAVLRQTADGHRIELSLSARPAQGAQRFVWITLALLLALTAAAYALVHRMLRPIRAIGEGARRFGAGQFEPPIPVQHARHPDELSELAQTVNHMAGDIRQMLDAKRTLLLAMSHELRSPLTRARLNAELLPEDAATQPTRDALLRDLGQMRELIADLLESERLASPHAALQFTPTDLPALARALIDELAVANPLAASVRLQADAALAAPLSLDAGRLRLLLRNLLDNALRHTPAGAPLPELRLRRSAEGVLIELRDHGPGVPPEQLAQLAEPFYRPDGARQRGTGGVGLGLYLARMVAQAHGGRLLLRNAEPGLLAQVVLPAHSDLQSNQ
ncbi:HAMP domain-containing sensor histidine kinase [Ottowia beijingensis]|uniref:HAMP domain-containing sensor histidine kinase n=1 Tax=Ottowia beijingensis TaxID=1207057 RepID=UPI002FDB4DE1